MKRVISNFLNAVAIFSVTALLPIKAFSLGCIGEWPNQICVQGKGSPLGSDRLVDEIACNKVTAPGEADNGLTLVLQSNDTAWAKNVAVIENGWAGRRNIANIQVPLNPIIRVDSSGFIPEDVLTYSGKGLVLEIRVLRIDGRPLNGGLAKLSLPGYETETVSLICDYIK